MEPMVQVSIEASEDPVTSLTEAREAVEVVLGSFGRVPRDLEDAGSESGVWLVRFDRLEWEVLEAQGFIDLEKGPFRIRAEMPLWPTQT